MGDHPDMLCEVCVFDKNVVLPTPENILSYMGLCKAKPGEPVCRWYRDQLVEVWRSIPGLMYPTAGTGV